MWKTKFPSHKQHLFDLLLPKKKSKKIPTDQGILQTLLLYLKRNVSQAFRSSNCKKVFSKCVYIWYNFPQWMFFTSCDNWETLFFIQIYRYAKNWYNCHVTAFLKQMFWKKSAFCICYLHNNITGLLIAKAHKTSPKFVCR